MQPGSALHELANADALETYCAATASQLDAVTALHCATELVTTYTQAPVPLAAATQSSSRLRFRSDTSTSAQASWYLNTPLEVV
jgi:hypothetical protein